jgi:hypothetical protein
MRAKKISLQRDIDEIIEKCDVCYVAMVDEENMPYLVPFNFGYKIYSSKDRRYALFLALIIRCMLRVSRLPAATACITEVFRPLGK